MNMPLRLVSTATTHPGLIRRVNEDRHCERPQDGLWVVADGMGAMPMATGRPMPWSRRWRRRAARRFRRGGADGGGRGAQRQSPYLGRGAASRAADGLDCRRAADPGDRFAALWVGDSRAYLLRDAMLVPLTRDHSQVQEMVDRGLIAPEDAAHHPRGHVLARAIGVGARIAVDVVADSVEPGDRFLLCSDGLSGPVVDEELRQSLSRSSPSEAVEALLAQALARGAPDNVTAIVVAAQEATRLTFADAGGDAHDAD